LKAQLEGFATVNGKNEEKMEPDRFGFGISIAVTAQFLIAVIVYAAFLI